jgi:hypothetical protein
MIIAARVGTTRLIDNAFVTCIPGVFDPTVAAHAAISR